MEVIRLLSNVCKIAGGGEPCLGILGTSSVGLGRTYRGLSCIEDLVSICEKERRSLLRSTYSKAVYMDA